MEYIGLPIRYDPVTQELTIKVSFLEPEVQAEIEYSIINRVVQKIRHTIFKKDNVSYKQQCTYYLILKQILMNSDIIPTADTMQVQDTRIRQSLFPAKTIDFGEEKIPDVKRMREMNPREMARVLDLLLDRYSYLGVKIEPRD